VVVDFGRSDIKIVEDNQVVDESTISKYKTLLIDPSSISDAVLPELNTSVFKIRLFIF
jgi:hypothetical protein